MKDKPLVSIIINNYNYGRFLNEAIDSALKQAYENIEVIVVDDGSTDNSREIMAGYGNKIIPVLKENGGQGSAYNAGFLKSHGKFICNLDSDDTLLPEALDKAISGFENDEIVKVQWPLWVVDKEGNNANEITTKWTPPEGNLTEMVLHDGPFYDFNLHTGSVVKRTFLDNILPMPEPAFRNGGDLYVTTLAPLFGQIRNCMDPLGTYRVHGTNNYAGRLLDNDRIKNYIARFETNCNALEWYAKKLGYEVDQELWKKRNFNYLWPHRLLAAKNDIAQMIPEGENYILVNENEWGEGEPVHHRHAIFFMEKNGNYDGPPADEAQAISEFKRLIAAGAGYIVFWWSSFWWFDHYETFFQYLQQNYRSILKNDRVVIFELLTNKEGMIAE